MPLGDEPPLSDAELAQIYESVNTQLQPIRDYAQLMRGGVIEPAAFLQLPLIQEKLLNIIDALAAVYDLLPQEAFLPRMNELIAYRDELLRLESHAEAAGNLPELVTLDIEMNERGYPQLAIPQAFVEMLISDANLTNPEIAEILGKSSATFLARSGRLDLTLTGELQAVL